VELAYGSDTTRMRAAPLEIRPMPDTIHDDQLEYYVTLDLGSDSMAACFQHLEDQTPTLIDLQRLAETLAPPKEGQLPVEFLLEEDNRTKAPRLRTRISLRPFQPSKLPESHAGLRLPVDKDKTIFGFFHREGRVLGEPLLPNPKLLFQTHVRDVIPRLVKAASETHEEVQYEAGDLLKHLTAQVLNNFVLGADELRQHAKRRGETFDPQRVLLTVTVPNVYSQTHARDLEDFIRRHVPVGAVHAMYESDAVAHFMVGEPQLLDPPEVKNFKERIQNCLAKQQANPKDRGGCRILTIDIGRGTTDLSLFVYDSSHQAEGVGLGFVVAARTGRSHGGARLSYILAEHLDARIQSVLERYKTNEGTPTKLKEAIDEKRTSVSLLRLPSRMAGRARLLASAERYVEKLKQILDERYRLKLDGKTSEEISALAKDLAAVVTSEVEAAGAINLAGEASEAVRTALNGMRVDLERAISFPKHLPGRGLTALFRSLLQPFGRVAGRADPFYALREKIEAYVRANVDEPLKWLREMAEKREIGEGALFRSEDTFVIVAGQASQFHPLQRAIRSRIKGEFQIPADKGGNLLSLQGALSKLACCYGAQWYYRPRVRCTNPHEILGTFGFLKRGGVPALLSLDMRELNQRNPVPVELQPGQHWFVFEPVYRPPVTITDATEINRITAQGTMAFVRTLDRSGRLAVHYQGVEEGITIVPIGALQSLPTFGNVSEDIYLKTWPEALPDVPPNSSHSH
jgi:hypothetical protein